MQGYTFQPDYTIKDGRFFGSVDIIIGTRVVNSRVIRVARPDKESAINDAGRLARTMLVFGVNAPINIEEYQ